jgi:hypothetical protein
VAAFEGADPSSVVELGRKGLVVVREQKRSVVPQLLKPRQAAAEVATQVPWTFHMGHFI